jgi:hypothetical protein
MCPLGRGPPIYGMLGDRKGTEAMAPFTAHQRELLVASRRARQLSRHTRGLATQGASTGFRRHLQGGCATASLANGARQEEIVRWEGRRCSQSNQAVLVGRAALAAPTHTAMLLLTQTVHAPPRTATRRPDMRWIALLRHQALVRHRALTSHAETVLPPASADDLTALGPLRLAFCADSSTWMKRESDTGLEDRHRAPDRQAANVPRVRQG